MINVDLKNIFFIDIETVPQESDFLCMSETMQLLWEKKSSFFRKEHESAAEVYQRAGIYAEFGKIICISLGFIYENKFRVKSFFGDDEYKLLKDFSTIINNPKNNTKVFCGHNIKEFDIPYICRRMLINGIELPAPLNISGKKPWEISNIDTLELWKFGDYKNFTSLALLAEIFNIPTPKDDIDGSQIYEVYYKEQNLNRISIYCEKDVMATANLLLRFMGKDIISVESLERI